MFFGYKFTIIWYGFQEVMGWFQDIFPVFIDHKTTYVEIFSVKICTKCNIRTSLLHLACVYGFNSCCRTKYSMGICHININYQKMFID